MVPCRTAVLWCALLLGCGLLLAGCSRPPQMQRLAGNAQGTTFHISWWSPDTVPSNTVQQAMRETLEQIDLWISNYRDDSLIEQFNRSTSTEWQTLPPDVIGLLAIARQVYRASDGCYDPTIAPLFDLWGFRSGTLSVPAEERIAAVMDEVGFDKIKLDVAGHRLRKTIPQVSIDMSSVGEGYTVWRLAQVLENAGVHDYLVELGGDMLIKGSKPDGSDWRVAIQRPLPGQMAIQEIVRVRDHDGVSINTSGTYRRYFDSEQRSYSHIIDARTGAPVTHQLVSATVFGSDPRISDAWATAMLCMGREQGGHVAREHGLSVFFVQQDDDNRLTESKTPALQNGSRVALE